MHKTKEDFKNREEEKIMELYGIVGAAQRKKTPKGRELLEVAFYSLDIETLDGKNQIIQIAFWDNLERYEKLITKGSRMRIFIDKLKPNPQIDKNGNPVVYYNANGQAFVYVNTGGGNNNNQGNQNQGGYNNSANQSKNTYNKDNNKNDNANQGNQQNQNTQNQNPKNEQMSDIESFLSSI